MRWMMQQLLMYSMGVATVGGGLVHDITCCRLCYAKSVSGKDGDQLMEIATIVGVGSRESGLLQPE